MKFSRNYKTPESQEYIQRAMRRVGPNGQAILNTKPITRAFAQDAAQQELQLKRMGNEKLRREENLAEDARRFNLNYQFNEDAFDDEQDDMGIANAIGVGNLVLSGLGAYQNYSNNKEMIADMTAFRKRLGV